MRIALLTLPLILSGFLSGCGVVEMIASGVADGTKFVINQVENEPQVRETRRQQGYPSAQETDPAAVGATTPAQGYPTQTNPAQTYSGQPAGQSGGATGAPAPLAAPVTPVTKGEPIN
ncbi:hypothetical protein N825_31000 [Skermanella stibiiresistens SB22]|uniref:Uncharacterized protein n=1 Tax=Skermanella stibiiresistens SB22 TaxID=1385369 RepID=W9H4U1_9PROT|nr:hypothetical protein [Skermanella stibiiresistens]EWY41240.1 hypothetical protein N825_31000 [Skermanella stibiiresistens SB22]